MYKLTLIAALALCPASASDAVRELQYGGDLTPRNITPTFDHGYLAVYDTDGVASIYSREGKLAYVIPKPEKGLIANVAVDEDGASAAAIDSGTHGTIAVTAADGSAGAIIEAAGFVPSFVTFAPDHTIWSLGHPPLGSAPAAPDFSVLRRFSRDGKPLGEFLPQSSFSGKGEPAGAIIGFAALRIANNRIGALLAHGRPDAIWVEADLDGKEIGRWSANFDGAPAGFVASGSVYARGANSILLLDHATGNWNPVQTTAPGPLIGADGNALVFKLRGQNRLAWMPVP